MRWVERHHVLVFLVLAGCVLLGTASHPADALAGFPTTTTIATSASPSALGQDVTFTATVTATTGIPTGPVSFFDESTEMGSGTLDASGHATFTTSQLPRGVHNISATYSGVSPYSPSTSNNVIVQTVKWGTTTTIGSISSASSLVGQSYRVNYSVAVIPPATGTPGGTVTVTDGTASCSGSLGSGAAGFCDLTSTTAGAKSITARYEGSTNYLGSVSEGVAHTVKWGTTTSISSISPTVSVVGQPYTVNFTVTASGGGTPTGEASVTDGAGASCTATVASHVCQITSMSADTRSVKVTYGGVGNYNGSESAVVSHTVNQASTKTTGENATITVGSPTVMLRATVTGVAPSTAPVNEGSVTFSVLSGSTVVGSAGPADVAAGTAQASLNPSNLAGGTYAIQASFGTATGNYSASSDSTKSLVINKKPTTLSVDAVTGTYHGMVSLAATLASGGTGVEGKTVAFKLAGVDKGTGITDSHGVATLTGVSLGEIAIGTHSGAVSATFAGDGTYEASSKTSDLTVGKAPSTTSLSSNRATPQNPSAIVDEKVTFTATVSTTASSVGTPGGTVTFYDEDTPIGSSDLSGGKATIEYSWHDTGSHTIKAVYAGTDIFAGSESLPITQWVTLSTLAVVSGLDAFIDGNGVYVQWETSSEMGTVGFYLYRQDPGTGEFRMVNRDLAPGTFNSRTGATYRLLDPEARPGGTYTYRLVEIEHGGGRISNGPYTVKALPDRWPALEAVADGFWMSLHEPPTSRDPAAEASSRPTAGAAPRPEAAPSTSPSSLQDLVQGMGKWLRSLVCQ